MKFAQNVGILQRNEGNSAKIRIGDKEMHLHLKLLPSKNVQNVISLFSNKNKRKKKMQKTKTGEISNDNIDLLQLS